MIGFDRPRRFYCGIDPGHHGSIAVLSADKSYAKVWAMPWQGAEHDLDGLHKVFRHLKLLPDCVIGIEWPTAWPGSFANVVRDAENFGRGKAYLESFAYLLGFEYRKIPPRLWKGRLGLPGKTHDPKNEKAAAKFKSLLPQHLPLIYGPRRGILSGPLDALLIAEAMRSEVLTAKFSPFVELGKRFAKQRK